MSLCMYGHCNCRSRYKVAVAFSDDRAGEYPVSPSLVCSNHLLPALDDLSSQCFLTDLWPAVFTLSGDRMLYHSYYDSELMGVNMLSGISNHVSELTARI
jgi:hypothetical protein